MWCWYTCDSKDKGARARQASVYTRTHIQGLCFLIDRSVHIQRHRQTSAKKESGRIINKKTHSLFLDPRRVCCLLGASALGIAVCVHLVYSQYFFNSRLSISFVIWDLTYNLEASRREFRKNFKKLQKRTSLHSQKLDTK